MAQILGVYADRVEVGNDQGAVKSVPIGAIRYANPQVGDQVKVYIKDEQPVVVLDESVAPAPQQVQQPQAAQHIAQEDSDHPDRRKIDKVLYIVIVLFLGMLGVHRFMRGQVGIGILMLLTAWLTLGIWPLIDLIIGLTKLSSYEGKNFIFTPDGRWTK